MFVTASGTADADEAVGQDSALKVGLELALHEAGRHGVAVSGADEEGLQTVAQRAVQDSALWISPDGLRAEGRAERVHRLQGAQELGRETLAAKRAFDGPTVNGRAHLRERGCAIG